GINERRQYANPPCHAFVVVSACLCMCVSDNNNNNQRLRQTTTYHVIPSSTIVFAADSKYTNSK
ncbi:MAG: hypothetical protein M3156_00405, partial [Thermoproteota archaeon]|nr:hypothetical protein [Thermoproteota archaeon]